jgi:ribosomal protein S18 acetylase RimI-like enzyme
VSRAAVIGSGDSWRILLSVETTNDATPPAYVVRRATLEDVGFLTDVVFAATEAQGRVSKEFDESGWRESLSESTKRQIRGEVPNCTANVIEFDNRSIGRLRVTRSRHRIEMNGIQLLPSFQGRGIGTAIIESLKVEAKDAGIDLDISVEKDNPSARRLYERLAFATIGEDDREYHLRWHG